MSSDAVMIADALRHVQMSHLRCAIGMECALESIDRLVRPVSVSAEVPTKYHSMLLVP